MESWLNVELQGSITEIKARHAASGDVVQTIKLEVHGDFSRLHELLKKPLLIELIEEEGGVQ